MSIKAYKGFDKNMQCRGFQFAEGETYHEDTAKLCESGFHACEMPLDTLTYYAPGEGSIYREVTLDEVSDERSDDSKRCAKTITIGKELGIGGLVEAQIKFVKESSSLRSETARAQGAAQATGNQGAAQATGDRGAALATGNQGAALETGNQGAAQATGDRGAALATGYKGAAQATGDRGAALATGNQGAALATGNQGAAQATGDRGAALATGYKGAAQATGDRGAAMATGNQGAALETGNQGAAQATGDRGAALATGYKGAAQATGYKGAAQATGKASVAAGCGFGCSVMGALGCAIFAVERTLEGTIISVASAIVDGEKIKPDTWYTCIGGKFIEST